MVVLTFCCAGMALAEGSSSLVVGTASIAVNTVTLPLSFVSGTGKTAGLEWSINVPGATSTTLQAGPAAISAGKTLYCNGNQCLLRSLDADTIPNGTVATLSVTLSSSAQGVLPVQLTGGFEALVDGTSGTITTANGTITPGSSIGPGLSGVVANSVTSSSAVITWATDAPSNSQAAYGTTSAYGSLSGLNSTLTTLHSVDLNGLTASTKYHYQVMSQDAQGNLSRSGDYTFTTQATQSGDQPLLLISGEPTVVSSLANNAVVTPTKAPTGFTGTLKVNQTGTVNFAAPGGHGVYFLNCCDATNNAYYQFSGATLGSLFDVQQGEIDFYLTSTKSYAERQAAGSFRTIFGVEDTTGRFLFSFIVQPGNFAYRLGSTAADYYYLPSAQLDTLFGKGATVKVKLTWDGANRYLYLNDVLAQKTPYTPAPASWSANSTFLLGGADLGYAVYNTSDDIISQFTVTKPAPTTESSQAGGPSK